MSYNHYFRIAEEAKTVLRGAVFAFGITPTLLIFFAISKMSHNADHIPVTTLIAFVIGSVVSVGSILYTLKTTKEIPLTDEQKLEAAQASKGIKATFQEIFVAVKEMPLVMKQMIPMMFFSWYAMFICWICIAKCLSRSVFSSSRAADAGFCEVNLLSGQIGTLYNFIAFVSAFGLASLVKKYGAKPMHATCLISAGLGLLLLPAIHNPLLVFIPMIGMVLFWASMIGNPYIILAGSIPANFTGVYIRIFNMFIVIPMLLQNLTMPLSLLGNSPLLLSS